MNRYRTLLLGSGLAACMMASVPALAQLANGGSHSAAQQRPFKITEQREPCRDFEPLRRPHFGDTPRAHGLVL